MLSETDSSGVTSTPEQTTTQIVPVTVPREIESEARARADRFNLALEDAIADHIRVVPSWCFSAAEEGIRPGAHRIALHTAVEPAVADVVDELARGDRREWFREAIREKGLPMEIVYAEYS